MSMPPAYHESLPYIDKDPSEEALAAARALIAGETAASQPSTTTVLPPSAADTLTLTPALQTELQRISSSTPLAPLDLSRYEAQEPPSSSTSPDALLPPFTNSCISSTYLTSRAQNLELLDRHGKNAWLLGNNELEAELKRLEQELAWVKAEVDMVNVERRRRQEEVKAEMELLEEGWKKGVGRVLETEVAVEELRERIREELRKASA